MRVSKAPGIQYVGALGILTAASVALLVIESVQTGELVFGYLAWNLFLAWLPFVLAVWLSRILRSKPWSSWPALGVTVAWLAFLPNSFYMVSDFIHLVELGPDQILIGAVTCTSFVLTSLCLGFSSLYLVHRELLKHVGKRAGATIVGALLGVSSLAIYIGRDLRWNSWDVLLNPFGLLFDVSERLLHPAQYPAALSVVLPFFVLLGSVYMVIWYGAQATRPAK